MPSIYYQCQRCTACCRWPGDANLTDEDVVRISAFLGLGEKEFIQRHTRLNKRRNGLSLLEKENKECAWLDGIDCTINEVKPQQCRDFPNKWNFPGWRQVCEAIPVEIPDAPLGAAEDA